MHQICSIIDKSWLKSTLIVQFLAFKGEFLLNFEDICPIISKSFLEWCTYDRSLTLSAYPQPKLFYLTSFQSYKQINIQLILQDILIEKDHYFWERQSTGSHELDQFIFFTRKVENKIRYGIHQFDFALFLR